MTRIYCFSSSLNSSVISMCLLTNFLLCLQEVTSIRLSRWGCSWQGKCRSLGLSSTWCVSAWVQSVEQEWWRGSSRTSTKLQEVVPTVWRMGTLWETDLEQKSSVPSFWCTQSYLLQIPSDKLVIPSCRYVTAITVKMFTASPLWSVARNSLLLSERSFSGLELAARFRVRKVVSCL